MSRAWLSYGVMKQVMVKIEVEVEMNASAGNKAGARESKDV